MLNLMGFLTFSLLLLEIYLWMRRFSVFWTVERWWSRFTEEFWAHLESEEDWQVWSHA